MISQNLLLCLLLSALAGTTTIAGKAVVISMARRRKSQQETTKTQKARMVFQFILFMASANVFTFLAPWFGPISIYWPATIASQLISNMIIVGVVMGHEKIDKNAQVATLIVVTAALYITINGPEPQNDQDIHELVFGNLVALIWLVILVSAYLGGLFLLCFGRLDKQSPFVAENVFLMLAVGASTLSATTSKAASTLNEGLYRTTLISVTWIILVLWTACSFKEAAYVRSMARYIPQVTFGSILLNALTGLIVWEDGKVVLSWTGYLTSLFLLGMGVYLISELDFFKAQAQDQQDFHRLQMDNIQDFFSDIEEDLAKARLEMTLGRHQVTIITESARRGIIRGASDPEVGAKSCGPLDDSENPEEYDQFTATVPSPLPSTRTSKAGCVDPSLTGISIGTGTRRGLTRSTSQRSLHSIDSISENLRNLKDFVGGISLDDEDNESITTTGQHNGCGTTTKSGSSCDVSFGGGSDIDSVRTTGNNSSVGICQAAAMAPNYRQQFLRQRSGLLELSRSSHHSRRRPRRNRSAGLEDTNIGLCDTLQTIDFVRRPPARTCSNASSVITFDDDDGNENEDDSSFAGGPRDSQAGPSENQMNERSNEVLTLSSENDEDKADEVVDAVFDLKGSSSVVNYAIDLKQPPTLADNHGKVVPRGMATPSEGTDSTMSSATTREDETSSMVVLEQNEHAIENEMDQLMDAIRNI